MGGRAHRAEKRLRHTKVRWRLRFMLGSGTCSVRPKKKPPGEADGAGGRQPGAGIILQPSPTLAHICPSSLFHPVCSPVRDRSISLYPSVTSNEIVQLGGAGRPK